MTEGKSTEGPGRLITGDLPRLAPPVTPPKEPDSLSEASAIYSASHWRLMWWRLRRHKLALAAAAFLALFYSVAIAAEFFATSDPHSSEASRALIPPQPIRWFDGWSFGPYVYEVRGERDPTTFRILYEIDRDSKVPIRLFARGFEYKFLGLITTDIHLFGVDSGRAEEYLFLLGTDVQGRDVWSRLMFATRISMSVGLVSVFISLLLGVIFGGLSGYYGGWIDSVIQRAIEVLRSIPTIPLWMGLAAAVPREWTILQVYFAITIIISLIGWTSLAREVRGRFLALREEDFVMAAALTGANQRRIIFRHMVPSFSSHIIAATTLALPAMIISETSLSFLGLGLRPPAVSWGVMLQAAQNVQAIAHSPWLLVPAIPVTLAVLSFNFLGDGLRDAADPYGV